MTTTFQPTGHRCDMAVTAEQLIEVAMKVLEARGYRVTQASEAITAEAAAKRERGEADAANQAEDERIAELKQLATEYNKEQDPT